ncbi:POMGNT1, partial [Symbiodinium sp. CCMP2456]
ASRPILAAPGSEIAAAELPGASCSSYCEDRGLRCLAEDLPFINSCDALSAIMGCRICEPGEGSDHPAQEVFTTRSGRCLHNTNFRQYPLTCDASHPDTRRLCVCRSILLPTDGRPEVPRLPTTSGPTTKTVTHLHRPALVTNPDAAVPVLVVATDSRPHHLQRCLDSLAKAEGYVPTLVLVSQDGDGKRVRDVVMTQGVLGHQLDTGKKPLGEKLALHYSEALRYAIE